MGELTAGLVLDLGSLSVLAPTAVAVCQGALARATSLPDQQLFVIWAEALALTADRSDGKDRIAVSGPTWLQAASREVCKRGPALAAYVDKRNASTRTELLDFLLWGQPGEIVADLIDALWNHASEGLRRCLADLIPDLIENAEEAGMHALAGSHSLGNRAAFDRIVDLAEAADETLPFMALGGLALWRRFGQRSLPYCVRLLPYALSQTDPGQRMEVVRAYVGDGGGIEVWLAAIREISVGDPKVASPLVDQALRAMTERFRDDRTSLARGLAYAFDSGAPLGLLKRLGHAYQRAMISQEIEGDKGGPEDRRAAEILADLFGRQAKRRTAKRPAKPKRKLGRPPGPDGQLALPLGKDEG
jgi:hypothetical protein